MEKPPAVIDESAYINDLTKAGYNVLSPEFDKSADLTRKNNGLESLEWTAQ